MRLLELGELRKLRAASTCVAGVLCIFSAVWARAEEPSFLPSLPTLAVGQDSSSVPPAQDARPMFSGPPWTDDQLENGLVGQHQAYMDKFGLWVAQPDPRAGYPVHVYADGGFLMVHSFITHNPAFLVTGPHPATIPNSSFNYDVNFAPRITLGAITDGGYGTRATWWQLDETSPIPFFPSKDATLATQVHSVPVFGVPGFTSPGAVAQKDKVFNDMLDFNNAVQVTVWDWDFFRQFNTERWSFVVGMGVRYLYLSQNYQAFRFNKGSLKLPNKTTLNLNLDRDFITSGRNFAGVGPTDFLEVRRRFGRSGFSLYGNAKGALMFGDTHTESFQNTTESLQTVPAKGAKSTTAASTSIQQNSFGHNILDVGDFETGIDWTMNYGRTLLFLRAGLADQMILGSGSATSDRGSINLFGLRFSAGFNY